MPPSKDFGLRRITSLAPSDGQLHDYAISTKLIYFGNRYFPCGLEVIRLAQHLALVQRFAATGYFPLNHGVGDIWNVRNVWSFLCSSNSQELPESYPPPELRRATQ